MAFTDVNSEGRRVQKTFTDRVRDVLGLERVYAFNYETVGPEAVCGVVLIHDVCAAIETLTGEGTL
jgi:hypothetical protein